MRQKRGHYTESWWKNNAGRRKRRKKFLPGESLEIFNDGYGFLRDTTVSADIYVSSSQIKKFG